MSRLLHALVLCVHADHMHLGRPGEVLICLYCASWAFMGHSRHPTARPSPFPWGGAACPGCAQSPLAQGSPSGSAAAVRGRQAVATRHPASPGGSVGHCPHGVALRVREHMTPSLFLPTCPLCAIRVPLRSVCSLAGSPWKEDPLSVHAPLLASRVGLHRLQWKFPSCMES